MPRILDKLLAISIGLATTTALACSPVQHTRITFPDHSAALDTKGALKLGGWLADMRVHFPNYSDFFIAPYIVQDKPGARELAVKRADTVRQFLLQRGFRPERTIAVPPVAGYAPASPPSVETVEIVFIPACPHGCCDLPTHKVKDLGLPMP